MKQEIQNSYRGIAILTMLLDPPCYFCKGKTECGGSMTGANPFTHIIRHCIPCNSEQHFIYGTDTLISFTFRPKSEIREYYVYYNMLTKKLSITHVDFSNETGLHWFPKVETILSEFPVWLAHDFISEHRIQTLMVFS